MGCCFIYGVLIAYLGPEFATGICRAFSTNQSTHVWVASTVSACSGLVGNATSIGGNESTIGGLNNVTLVT
jgi:hypothetical protein